MQIVALATTALMAIVSVSAAAVTNSDSSNVLQKRYDLRQLYSFQGGDSTAACNAWRCACINYVPKDTSLHFVNAICEPGDYKGQNANSQAKAACAFAPDGGAPKSINQHAAAAAKFTLVNNN